MICDPEATYAELKHAMCWRGIEPPLQVETWRLVDVVPRPRHELYVIVKRGVCLRRGDVARSLTRAEFALLQKFWPRRQYTVAYNLLTHRLFLGALPEGETALNAVAMQCGEERCYLAVVYNSEWAKYAFLQ